MKQLKNFCLFLLFLTGTNCLGQVNNLNCDSNNYSVFRKYKGDMIQVTCDTIYVLNKFTFNLMYRSYNDFRNQNLLLNQYTLLNDSISGLYESQLEEQKNYFDTLNSYFNKLADSADTLVNKSKDNLGTISQNLNSIESQITSAKENISNAQKDIKEAKKQMRKEKWKWGAGGFTIGAALVFVLSIVL